MRWWKWRSCLGGSRWGGFLGDYVRARSSRQHFLAHPRRAAPAVRDAYAWAASPLIETDPVRRRRDRHACPPDTPGKTHQDRGSGVIVHIAGKSLAARRLTCEAGERLFFLSSPVIQSLGEEGALLSILTFDVPPTIFSAGRTEGSGPMRAPAPRNPRSWRSPCCSWCSGSSCRSRARPRRRSAAPRIGTALR